MKIAILGNSNALLSDGWVQALRKLIPNEELTNLSVGGSASPALLYQVHSRAKAVENSDVVIIEPTVVDHGSEWQSPARIATYAEATIESAKETGAVVVLLVLPRHGEFVYEPSPGMIAWTGAAKRAGIEVIDIRDQLLIEATKLGSPLEALWRDDRGHLTADMQFMVGKIVVERLQNLQKAKVGKSQKFNLYRVLSGEDIAQQCGVNLVMRQTSVMSMGAALLKKGEQVTLELGDRETILGFMLNYGTLDHTQPVLLDTSAKDGSATKRLNLGNSFLTAKPSRTLVAMFRPTLIPSGHCRLEFICNGEEVGAPNCIELCGIFVGPEAKPNENWNSDGIEPLSAT